MLQLRERALGSDVIIIMLRGRESFTCGSVWLTGPQPWSLKTAAVCWNYRAQWLTLFLCLRPLGCFRNGTSPHSKTGSPQRNCLLIKITNSFVLLCSVGPADHLEAFIIFVITCWSTKRNVNPEFYTQEETGHDGTFMKSYEKKNNSSRPPKKLLWFFIFKITFA